MRNEILFGDCRASLREMAAAGIVAQTCVTSPPYYGLRDYGHEGQIGLEATPDLYVSRLVEVFRCVCDVLADDGTLWLNIGDSYSDGKQLLMIPSILALALKADGWVLRQRIVWAKPNSMPSSVTDRCTSSHEDVFLFSKSAKYFSDFDAIKTPPRESSLVRLTQDIQSQAGSHRGNGGKKTNGPMKAAGIADKQRGHSRQHAGFNTRWDAMERSEQMSKPANMRDVWFVSPKGYNGAHFAVMPEEIARRCILAGSHMGDLVLDPFMGSGTTAAVSVEHGRSFAGCELNAEYKPLQDERIAAAHVAVADRIEAMRVAALQPDMFEVVNG